MARAHRPTEEEIDALREERTAAHPSLSWPYYDRKQYRDERGWIRYRRYDAVARARSLQVRIDNADNFARRCWPQIRELLESGFRWKAIAKRLNKKRVRTRRGKKWDSITVRRVADRMGWKPPPVNEASCQAITNQTCGLPTAEDPQSKLCGPKETA